MANHNQMNVKDGFGCSLKTQAKDFHPQHVGALKSDTSVDLTGKPK